MNIKKYSRYGIIMITVGEDETFYFVTLHGTSGGFTYIS